MMATALKETPKKISRPASRARDAASFSRRHHTSDRHDKAQLEWLKDQQAKRARETKAAKRPANATTERRARMQLRKLAWRLGKDADGNILGATAEVGRLNAAIDKAKQAKKRAAERTKAELERSRASASNNGKGRQKRRRKAKASAS